MTQPHKKQEAQKAAELIGQGAKSLVTDARRLGLTWTLRPATVASLDDPTTGLIGVVYDGDTIITVATSLVGTVSLKDRVMGMLIPPAGNFILANLTNGPFPYSPDRGIVGSHQEVVNSGVITVLATIMTTDQTINFKSGHAYEFSFAHSHFSSAAGVLAQYQVDLTGGGLAIHMGNYRTEGASSTGVSHTKIAVCSADITDTAILQAVAVSGNITMLGSTTAPRQFWVRDLGSDFLYQNFVTF